jgi:PAS domain S-box-containing protein
MELIECIELPVLVIDRALTLVSFNPAAATLLSLTSSDHGRQLRSIQMLSRMQHLEELCGHVIASGSSSRVEVADGAGSWYSLSIGCDKTNQNLNGAVLTLTNVTAFRESLERAIEEREYTKAVINTIADALVVVDADFRIQAANQAFYALFQTSRDASQGAYFYQLGSGDWDLPQLRALLDGSSPPNEGLTSLECEHEFLTAGRRALLLNSRRLIRGNRLGQMTLITIQDITERKRAMEALRESEEELRILDRVGATLASELDLKKLVQGITDAGRELSQAEFGAFFYNDTDEAGEKYLLYTLSGAPEEAFKNFGMPRNTEVFGPTFRGERTVRVADIGQDPRYGKSPPHHGIPAGHPPVRSYLAVPVISRSTEVIGGLFFGHSKAGVFTERAERLIEGVAKQAAIAIDNARLFEAIRNQRIRAEESEERFRAIVETTSGCVKLVAADGTLLHMNSVGLSMLQADFLEAVIGKNIYDVIAPEHRETYREFNERICRGERGSLEFDIVGFKGLRRHMETHAAPLQTADGCVQLAVSLDITSRKEAEQVLRRLAAIVESSGDAIVSKDLNGIVTSWNPACEKMFGYSADEMIGRPITVIIPPELQETESHILETIRGGERIEHLETVRLTKNGERIDVSLTISPVRDETGRVIGVAKTARDITQEKKTEQALRTSERLASVGRLAATVAHEINNPLEAVTNLVYLAKGSVLPKDVREYLDAIEEELEHISHITKQTLGFYRESTAPSAVRIGAMLMPLIAVFNSRARNKGAEIRPEIRQDPEFYAIPGEIRQLIANLLSNSIDAVDSGGLIRIRVDATPFSGQGCPGTRITVADSGRGIPLSIRSKLFEPFFTTKKDVGTGLGLWVCTNIVKRHHGSIRVRSSTIPGRSWTVFSVFLPCRQESENEHLSQKV